MITWERRDREKIKEIPDREKRSEKEHIKRREKENRLEIREAIREARGYLVQRCLILFPFLLIVEEKNVVTSHTEEHTLPLLKHPRVLC